MRDRFLSYVVCGVLAVAFPITVLAQAGAQGTESSTEPANSTTTASATTPSTESQLPRSSSSVRETPSTELPDSPGTVQEQVQSAQPMAQSVQQQESNPAQPTGAPSSQNEVQPQASQDATPQRPLGTAAAGAPTVSGITAAEPAGIAIAPAKQHRVRTILIRVGAVVGAGVAVGTVVALSEATPSKPPRAR